MFNNFRRRNTNANPIADLNALPYPNYIIMLSNKYFVDNNDRTSCFFRKRRMRIVEELEDKGIKVISINDISQYAQNNNYMFNEEQIPKSNVLYVHLLNGEYYTDDIYSKKKMEREREILFLLAGKLGVREIKYNTKITEITLTNTNISADVKSVNVKAAYKKSITQTDETSGTETYLNRGAPAYTLSKSIEQIEENIKRKLSKFKSKIFSYDFYQNSIKLQTFVYKRFNFKMISLEYTSESEDIIEKSFEVKSVLMSYGIGITFERYDRTLETITYSISFFTDIELRIKLDHIIQLKNDPFCVIKEIYTHMKEQEREDEAIYRITQYVLKVAKGYDFVIKNNRGSDESSVLCSYYNKLNDWIKEQEPHIFEKICSSFASTFQIKLWLRRTLKLNNNEYYDYTTQQDNEDYGFFKKQKQKYEKYLKTLLEKNSDNDSLDGYDNELNADAELDVAPTSDNDADNDFYTDDSDDCEDY